MRILSYIAKEIKFWEECNKYGVSIWECPRFLFLIMGLVTVVSMVATNLIAIRYADPEIVVISVASVAVLIFSVGNVVVRSFEKVANVSRMKTEFVSIVSHQLRSPLTALKWSLNLLISKDSNLNQNEREYLEIIREGNERMIKLVNDLLSVTRIEQGRLAYNKEDFDIIKLAESLVLEVKSFADANNVDLKLLGDKGPLNIHADKQYITMVVSNLIDNAIRYIPKTGKVEVVLKKNKNFVDAKIKDNGIGIPKDEQKNIFHKFFRSTSVMRHRTEGTGLGLYLAKAFVEAHGGRIGFVSTEGAGTTFWFTLPLSKKINNQRLKSQASE